MHVGNDIVDLLSPYVMKKSGDRKFVQRVLTAEEQKTVFNSPTPDKLLQVHWAAKETAYKAIAKSYPDISSAPRRYPVFLDDRQGRDIRGRVKTPRDLVYFTARPHRDFIHCFGTCPVPADTRIVYGIKKMDVRAPTDFCRSSPAESRAVRFLAQKKIASLLSIPENDITITKTDRPKGTFFPEVYVNRKKTHISISFSHDGRFIAYALIIHPALLNLLFS